MKNEVNQKNAVKRFFCENGGRFKIVQLVDCYLVKNECLSETWQFPFKSVNEAKDYVISVRRIYGFE